ncbi:MAG: FAD-dependent thymidylate synthase [Chloroflexi bacterium]|nr:FAD-dependent thymidylate synthase [Chloroflexota bacterium]
MYFQESFTPAEIEVLSRFFTNTDLPVFALVNLPEVVKGALFARYSRSPKSLRRLFLDEFVNRPEAGLSAIADQVAADDPMVRIKRAEQLYERVFDEFGDDSVAQLGGAHLACEQASNILTKVLEWGRLAAYLEQSTRYIFYDQRLGERYRYLVPPEISGSKLAAVYATTMDWLFDTYSSIVRSLVPFYEKQFADVPGGAEGAMRASIRARACDSARGLLPAATLSNVGIFATGQAYEAMLLRMRAHPLEEVRSYANLMLHELRKVVQSFMRRVDLPERGVLWSRYLEQTAQQMKELAGGLQDEPQARPEVVLVDWEREAETRVVAAALYPYTDLPDDQLLEIARQMPADERARVIRTYVGERKNRRHKPGRGMERVYYRFDLLSDFGSFRDLQRHRMLTIDWQRLGTRHGYVTPADIEATGQGGPWRKAMDRMSGLHGRLVQELGPDVGQYAVPFAFKLRYTMQLNAREAFHMLELRTSPQGHPDYRRVCLEMHRLIREQAGHTLIADAMTYINSESHELGRLEAERRAAAKRRPQRKEAQD